ncbi:MAG: 3-phosphoshikimate 1-carboxyvinyltransferase [Thermoguttaceae bacterium]
MMNPSGPVASVVTPPGSKSLTNRAILVAALADGQSRLDGCLDSEDTRVMQDALKTLGIELTSSPDGTTGNVHVAICGHRFASLVPQADLYVAGSGTTLRFLAAALALAKGSYRLFGTPRMHERPIAPLVSALEPWGGRIAVDKREDGTPFLGVAPANSPTSDTAKIASDQSSQFLSGLLLAAPLVARHFSSGVRIEVDGTPVSQPYITMTLEVMRMFGVSVDAEADLTSFAIPRDAAYRAAHVTIEPDASAASYFFAAAAICGGRIEVPRLGRNSLQGDVRFVELLEAMGCRVKLGADSTVERDPSQVLRGIVADMNAISDTVQTLAVVALFADSPTTITNIAHIRLKETDRLAAVACELRRLGAVVDERHDAITITPQPQYRAAKIETYQDHRMAMSFALAGLRIPGVGIADAACCEKTFPRFFDVLDAIATPR